MIENDRQRSPAAVMAMMIRLHHDISRMRSELADLQMAYDATAKELATLAASDSGDIRWIFHDAYIESIGYLPHLVEIWPNGQVQLVEVEKAVNLKWPESPPPVAAHAATVVNCCDGEGEVPELNSEIVQAALKPEDGWDTFWARSRQRVDSGDPKCAPN